MAILISILITLCVYLCIEGAKNIYISNFYKKNTNQLEMDLYTYTKSIFPLDRIEEAIATTKLKGTTQLVIGCGILITLLINCW